MSRSEPKTYKAISFHISIILIALGSLSICLTPYARFDGDARQKIIAYVIGIAFWSFTIAGYLILLKVNKNRKAGSKQQIKTVQRGVPGILRFFSCREAALADVITMVSLAALILLMVNHASVSLLSTAVFSIFILFVQLRAILNGEIFMYIKYLSRRPKKNESGSEL